MIRTRILKLTNLKEKLKKRLKNVKKSKIKYYNKRYSSQFYKVKHRMLLIFKNIVFNRFSKKLNFKFYKLYEITNFVKKNDISTDFVQNILIAKYSRRFSCFIVRIVYKETRYRFNIIRYRDEKKSNEKLNRFLMSEVIEKKNQGCQIIKLFRARKSINKKSKFKEWQKTVDCLWRKSTGQKENNWCVDTKTKENRQKNEKMKFDKKSTMTRFYTLFIIFS